MLGACFHKAAIWAISPGPPIGQPTGLLASAVVETNLHLTYSVHVFTKSIGIWDLPWLVQALCVGRVSAFIQPVAKVFENQKSSGKENVPDLLNFKVRGQTMY